MREGAGAVQHNGHVADLSIDCIGNIEGEGTILQSEFTAEGSQGLRIAPGKDRLLTACDGFAGDQLAGVTVGPIDQEPWHLSFAAGLNEACGQGGILYHTTWDADGSQTRRGVQI
jgi:hypothetical protein